MTLVLLPGMDGTGTLFDSFVSAFAGSGNQVKIVKYSPIDPLGYIDLEEIARASLPKDGPFVILGESFSGPIAVSIAASCPARLKGLVLCCSFIRNPYPFTSYLKPLVELLPITGTSTSILRNILLGRFATNALRSALGKAISQVSAQVIRARLRAVVEVDVSEKLAAITAPVLYLRASDDRVVPRAASRIIMSLKPEVQLVQLEAPHFLLQSAPVEAAEIISAFVCEVGNKESAV